MQQSLNVTQVCIDLPKEKPTPSWKVRIMNEKVVKDALKVIADKKRKKRLAEEYAARCKEPEPEQEKEFDSFAVQKFEQRKASAPAHSYTTFKRNAPGFKFTQNLDWDFLGPCSPTSRYIPEPEVIKTARRPKVPKISVTTASATIKYDSTFMTLSELDNSNFLTVSPSARAKTSCSSQRRSKTSCKSHRRSERLSEATTACTDVSMNSARSSAMSSARYDSVLEPSVIKVSDLLNQT